MKIGIGAVLIITQTLFTGIAYADRVPTPILTRLNTSVSTSPVGLYTNQDASAVRFVGMNLRDPDDPTFIMDEFDYYIRQPQMDNHSWEFDLEDSLGATRGTLNAYRWSLGDNGSRYYLDMTVNDEFHSVYFDADGNGNVVNVWYDASLETPQHSSKFRLANISDRSTSTCVHQISDAGVYSCINGRRDNTDSRSMPIASAMMDQGIRMLVWSFGGTLKRLGQGVKAVANGIKHLAMDKKVQYFTALIVVVGAGISCTVATAGTATYACYVGAYAAGIGLGFAVGWDAMQANADAARRESNLRMSGAMACYDGNACISGVITGCDPIEPGPCP